MDEQLVSSDKALASTLMKGLSSMTFNKSHTVHDHIMEMRNIAAKFKSLEVDMSEPFLVHFILNSLPAKYGYTVNSKGFRFYCPSPKIIEAGNAKFLEEHKENRSGLTQRMELEEMRAPPVVPLYIENLNVAQKNSHELYEQEQVQDPPPLEEPHEDQSTLPEPIEETSETMRVRKSSRVRKSVISNGYVVYLKEFDYDIRIKNGPCSFSQAMRYQSNPGLDHWKAGKRVLRYLQRTKDFKLIYKCSNSLEVIVYSDSDLGGCKDIGKSTSGYIFLLAGGVNFISGLRIADYISRLLRFFCDNSATVFFSKNNKSGSRSKHINIKYLMVRDYVKKQDVNFEHISTTLMIADPMIKGLPANIFKDHVNHMGINSSI
uniref:Uncharacterized protein n=1 Tax=Nicotiana tabacum TaxID=4097 RepID=A0A1S4CHP8_TOBAC|nr:PREDICTED: uncharacterized protein LOC107818968 [Nicotiana tabacum]